MCCIAHFVLPSDLVLAALAVLLSQCQNGKKLWWEWGRKSRRLTRKRKLRPRAKMQPLPCEVHEKIDEYERAVKQRMAVSRNDHILVFGKVFKTSLTSWNSFNIYFAILLTLCCTLLTVPKVRDMPINSNAQVSPVSSKVIEMCVRHTLQICITPSI